MQPQQPVSLPGLHREGPVRRFDDTRLHLRYDAASLAAGSAASARSTIVELRKPLQLLASGARQDDAIVVDHQAVEGDGHQA